MASKYVPVQDEEKFEEVDFRKRSNSTHSFGSTLLADDYQDADIVESSRWQFSQKWMWLVHVVLLSLSFTMFVSAYYNRLSTLTHVQLFSAYSPAAPAVEYKSVKFNTTVGDASPYVGYGAEVDAAWHAMYYDVGDQMISEMQLETLGMPKTSIKVTNPKTGAEGYRVGLEVFHQLHCVNLLRQLAYKDHYETITGVANPEELQMHTDHCLEILRMNVQCNSDIGLYTFDMLPGSSTPWPQLNTQHTCRNFDAIKEWATEHSVGHMEGPVVEIEKEY
ncbi:hypothetical protein F5884DRAFT_178817 [Xylogone sp. PMI_703]|nr:hypothetical protein F5884DRAFT_178817 [Xylogone sp. PMI_703]